MKCRAFILSICLISYLAEFVVIPRMMGAAASPVVAESGCCGKAMHGVAMPCGNEMSRAMRCPNPGKKCPATTDCCLNCPICSPVLLPAGREARLLPVVERAYPPFEPSYLYLYQASAWKPPNEV